MHVLSSQTPDRTWILLVGLLSCPLLMLGQLFAQESATTTSPKRLRHVVLFKFKPDTSQADQDRVAAAFAALPNKIDEIVDFEWGVNNSPEELDKGFTHCFFISFADEKGREAYLPHPAHQAFVEVLKPHLEDVLVVDYWTND